MLLSGMLLIFVAVGCCCPQPPAPVAEAPAPVVAAPPEAPKPPPPPPVVVEAPKPPPPPPAPPVVPPAVAKAIQDLSDKYPGLFKFDKDKGLLYFSSDVTFDSGSAVVKPDAQAALGKLAKILADDEVKDRRLAIIGHTDTDRVVKQATIDALKKLGKSTDNMGLAEARSEAVAAVLQAGGIDAARMATRGKGDTEPVADNRTPDGKARNRRVEIYLTPVKSAL
jgi:OOP family OmpA-OmpF porin